MPKAERIETVPGRWSSLVVSVPETTLTLLSATCSAWADIEESETGMRAPPSPSIVAGRLLAEALRDPIAAARRLYAESGLSAR